MSDLRPWRTFTSIKFLNYSTCKLTCFRRTLNIEDHFHIGPFRFHLFVYVLSCIFTSYSSYLPCVSFHHWPYLAEVPSVNRWSNPPWPSASGFPGCHGWAFPQMWQWKIPPGWWWLEHDWVIFPYIGNDHPNWLIFFRRVGIPPTSLSMMVQREDQRTKRWLFNCHVGFLEGIY